METAVLDRLKREIAYEFAREGPPEGFPKFPDIPGGRYRNPAFFELEMAHMWPSAWLFTARQEDMPEPGYYRTWEYLNMPTLVVRGNDRKLRAFRNLAADGRRLVEPADESSLVREIPFDSAGHNLKVQDNFPRYQLPGGVITNPQTGRVYSPEGALIGGPGFDDPALPPSERHLDEIRCETFDGWVFTSRDPNQLPLLEWLGPIPSQMAQFQGENLRIIDRRWTIIPCNWKVTVEAFQEVYHFKHIHHKGGVSALDQRGAIMGILPNGHSRMVTPMSKRMAEMMGMADQYDWRTDISRQGFSASPDKALMPEIPTVNGMVRCTSTAFSAFPNLITPVNQTGMPFLLAWPLDVGTTLYEWVTFTVDWGDGPSPVSHPLWQQKLTGFDGVMEEDTRNMAPMQKSLNSPGLTGMPTSYQERRIWNCAEQLDRMIGPERIPPELRVPQLLAPYVER